MTKPKPSTKLIKDKFDQIKDPSFVNTPKSNPKNAGAIDEFGPSEIEGVAINANTTAQLIPPNG